MTAAADTGVDLASLQARLAAAPDAELLRPIGLRWVVAGEDALAALPGIGGELFGPVPAPVALLVDATPMWRGPDDLKAVVRDLLAGPGWQVRLVQAGSATGRVYADEATLLAAREAVRGTRGIVTVGSGTLADIGKDVAEAVGLPHVIVQSAASVNGFADSQSVLLRNGVKRTVGTRWPDALLLDAQALASAPAPLNRAGLGDLLSMFTAPADWYLAHAVGLDDSYAPTAVALGRELGDDLLALAPALRDNEPAAVVRLAEILTVSGISMGVADRTAPSSGMEHTISHLLEMAATARRRPTALHGATVGVATVIAALTWRHVRDHIARVGLRRWFPTPAQMRERIHTAFDRLDPSGVTADECWADYSRKLARWHTGKDAVERLTARWTEHQFALGQLLGDPARIVEALRAAGAPVRFAELDPPVDPALARWAITNCHLMRDRFTVADLGWFLGAWDHDGVAAVLAAAAELGAGL
jgi:glycerol-1-phosphate dehydrogenase [NAD(P)+]